MPKSPSNPLRSLAAVAIAVLLVGGAQVLVRGFRGRPPPHVCERT